MTVKAQSASPATSLEALHDPAAIEAAEPGRGREARTPLQIPPKGWGDILWRTWREAMHDKLTLVAAGVTYCTLLAIFPALGVFVSVYGLVADVHDVQQQLVALSVFFPPSVLTVLGDQMVRLAASRPEGLSLAFFLSLLLSLWSANAGMKALFDGVNTAYDQRDRRNFFQRTLVTYGFTAGFVAFLVAVSGIMVAVPMLLDRLAVASGVLIAFRWVALFAVSGLSFGIIYRYAPSRRHARWSWIAPGAVAASLLWLALSAGFSWYVNHVVRLDATYGSLGAVMAFMLWTWFSALVVLLGAELNAEAEHQTAEDTTIGPAKPMGQRDASVADTLGRRFVGFGGLWRDASGRLGRLRTARLRAPKGGRPDPRRPAGR